MSLSFVAFVLAVMKSDVEEARVIFLSSLHPNPQADFRRTDDPAYEKYVHERAADIVFTPFEWACLEADVDMVEFLLECGSWVNHVDGAGVQPIHRAAGGGSVEILEEIRLYLDVPGEWDVRGKRRLTFNAYRGSGDVVQFHFPFNRFKGDIDVRTLDKFSSTPLHYAAGSGSTDCAIRLDDLGADVNARDQFDNTPLHNAALWGRAETSYHLLDRGGSIHAVGYKQRTPLQRAQWAVKSDDEEFVEKRAQTEETIEFLKFTVNRPEPERRLYSLLSKRTHIRRLLKFNKVLLKDHEREELILEGLSFQRLFCSYNSRFQQIFCLEMSRLKKKWTPKELLQSLSLISAAKRLEKLRALTDISREMIEIVYEGETITALDYFARYSFSFYCNKFYKLFHDQFQPVNAILNNDELVDDLLDEDDDPTFWDE